MEKEVKKLPVRILPEHAASILNISLRSAQNELREIKKLNSKKFKKKYVTLKEFCDYTGFTVEEINIHFNGFDNKETG